MTLYVDSSALLDADETWTTCSLASDLAERTGARSLDALHLAAGQRAGGSAIMMLTLDVRLGDAARSLGMRVPVVGDVGPARAPDPVVTIQGGQDMAVNEDGPS